VYAELRGTLAASTTWGKGMSAFATASWTTALTRFTTVASVGEPAERTRRSARARGW